MSKGLGKWMRGPDTKNPCVRLLFEPNRANTERANDERKRAEAEPDAAEAVQDAAAEASPSEVVPKDPHEATRDHDAFYKLNKANRCVVCGLDRNYVRHSITPGLYRLVPCVWVCVGGCDHSEACRVRE